MKKETFALLAGTLCVVTVFGILGFRKFLCMKQHEYEDEYSDYHRHFSKKAKKAGDEDHGIEFMAMM